jgi:hypothetical protein
VLLDHNLFNNSHVVKENPRPVQKASNYWVFVTQWIGQAFAWWGV